MKYRLKFKKEDEIKFIGHLDLMRVFQKAIRRAQIPIAYSEGFNPHHLVTFPLPLTLGATSEGEYMELQLTKEMNIEILCEQLNQQLPLGLIILDGLPLLDTSTKGMTIVQGAQYELRYPILLAQSLNWQSKIHEFLNQTQIMIKKQTKTKTQMVNIREGIYCMDGWNAGQRLVLDLFLAAGSRQNIRPEWVMESFLQFCGLPFSASQLQIHRKDLFALKNKEWVSLQHFID